MRTFCLAAGLAMIAAAALSHRDPGPALQAIPAAATPPPVPGSRPPVPGVSGRIPQSLRGRVVDGRGRPVPAALVEATRPRLPRVVDGALLLGHATTDAGGRFEIPGVVEARLTARLGTYGFAQLDVVDPGPHELRFPAESWIEGTVMTPAGAALSGAEVVVRARPRDRSCPAVELAVRSDEVGFFRLGPLSPAYGAVLEARAPGRRPQRTPAELREGTTTEADLVLATGRTLAGEIRSDDGSPVEGARVEVSQGDGLRFLAVSDAAGRFELDGLDDRPATITIRHDLHEPYAGTDSVVTLRRRTAVEGRIVPAAEGLHVVATAGNVRYRTPVGAEGRFRLEGVPRGALRLDVETSDRRALVSRIIQAGASGELMIVIP